MKLLMMCALMLGAYSAPAIASELDREDSVVNAGRELTGTTVLRVNNKTGEVAVLKSDKEVRSEKEAKALASKGRFQKVDKNRTRSELDNDAGASSWYFYYNPRYSYNYYDYYYYGRTYSPYYYYSYMSYTYYYYSSCGYYGGRCW